MENHRQAFLIRECLRQEVNSYCQQLSSQLLILAKVNGLLTKDLSLIPKDKSECLDSNINDTWMAKYVDKCLEVLYQHVFEQTEPPALLNMKIQADLSCIRFDCANRLWMCNQSGFVEILDVKRSIKALAVVRYVCFRLQDKIAYSNIQLPVSGKMLKANQLKTFMAAKKSNSSIVVFKCHTKTKPDLVTTVTNICDQSRSKMIRTLHCRFHSLHRRR